MTAHINDDIRENIRPHIGGISDPIDGRTVYILRSSWLDLTQVELARILGSTPATISRWETEDTLCKGVYARMLSIIVKDPELLVELIEFENLRMKPSWTPPTLETTTPAVEPTPSSPQQPDDGLTYMQRVRQQGTKTK